MAPKPPANQYTAYFNAIINNAHRTPSSGGLPAVSAKTAPVANNSVASIIASGALNSPIVAAAPKQTTDNPMAALDFGSKIADLFSRGSYAVGSMVQGDITDYVNHLKYQNDPNSLTAEEKAGIGRNPLEKLGAAGANAWKGLSGENKITPGRALINATGQKGFLGFLESFGIDMLTDPLNAVNPLKAGTAAINAVRGAKGLDKIEVPILSLSRKARTLAPETGRAVPLDNPVKLDVPANAPKDVKDAIKKAKTPDEINSANKKVQALTTHDAIQTGLSEAKQALPDVTAPVAPAVQAGEFSKRVAMTEQLMKDNPGMSYDDAFNQADITLTPPVVIPPAPKVVPKTTGKMTDAFGFKAAPDALLPAAPTKAAEQVAAAVSVAETVVPKLKSKLAGAFNFKGLPDNLIPTAAKSAEKAINKIEEVAKVTPASIPESVVPDITRGIDAAKAAAAVEGGFGNASQASQFIRFKNDAVKAVKAASPSSGQWISSSARNNLITEQTLGKMKAAEEAAASQGASHFVSATQNGKKWALKGSDVMETLNPITVSLHVVGGTQKAVHFSAIMRGAARALEIAPHGLKKTEAITEIARAMKTGGSSGNAMSLSTVANDLWHKTPQLLDRVTTNEARMGLKAGQDIPLLSDSVMGNITTALGSQAPKAMVDAIVDAPKAIAKMGEQIGAAPEAIAKATEDVATKVAAEIDHSSYVFVQAANRSVALRAAGKLPEAQAVIKAAAKEVEQVAVKEAGVDVPASAISSVDDLTDKYATGQFAVMSHYDRIVASRDATVQATKELQRSQGVVGYAGTQIGQFHKGLNAIQKEMTSAQILAETSVIKQGGRASNTKLQAAFDLVYGDHSLFGPLWRNGATVDQINKAINASFKGAKGKTPKFDDIITKDAETMANQWKDWVIDDPLDHLSRMYDASRKLIANQTVAMTMETNFGSLVRRPGYVQIAAKESDLIATHLNPKMWFAPHAAAGIDFMEWAAGAERNFAGRSGTLGTFINKVYDPALNAWKTYATIVRPANHIRNFFGDAALNHLAGMNNLPKWYTAATEILIKKTGSKYAQTVTIKGQQHVYSGDRAYRAAEANGMFPNFRQLEDIGDVGKSKFNKVIMNNKLVRAGGKGSEEISAQGKLAQFLWELSRPENLKIAKSPAHLEAIAARNVRKWHPDSTGLNPTEARIVKRIIPFYSWIRQAIPLVGEAAITRPGRVMALPKANYDLAVANGVDPASVSDQFPESGHYPSYLTTNILGPNDLLGKGTGFNFGSPVESVFGDVLNQYGNSFSTDRAGSSYVNGKFTGFTPTDLLSPMIKAPLELMTGTRFSSGKPIVDKGEYIDQNIPLVSNLSAISGYSPTGTVTNALGFGPTKAPTLDPIRAVVRGERQHWLNMNLVNFLTGVGLTQFNDPSTERNAKREVSALQAGQVR